MKKIIIINHFSTNKGDAAICTSLLYLLKKAGYTDIWVSANEPRAWLEAADSEGIYTNIVSWGWPGAKGSNTLSAKFRNIVIHLFYSRVAFPYLRNKVLKGKTPRHRFFFCNREYIKQLLSSDLVISTGGHHLTSLNAPEAICSQTFDMALATLYKKPLILWSQTIGPFCFKKKNNAELIKRILQHSCQIVAREEASVRELKGFGIKESDITVSPDTVFSLRPFLKSIKVLPERQKIVGVSVYTVKNRKPSEYLNYVETMSSIIEWAIKNNHRVIFFPMAYYGDDLKCINDIINKVPKSGVCEIFPVDKGVVEHLVALRRCSFCVGHKTHSVIFSLVHDIPVVAISYHIKTIEFMKCFGLLDYTITDTDLNKERLINSIEMLNRNIENVRTIISAKSDEFAGSVERVFQMTIPTIL